MTEPTGRCQWIVDGKACGRLLRSPRAGQPSKRRYCFLHQGDALDAAHRREGARAALTALGERVEAIPMTEPAFVRSVVLALIDEAKKELG
jgi:hypothetical protein